MNLRRNLLWIDGSAGAFVGVAMLLANGWLTDWYGLPRPLVVFIGAANLAYGTYALSLAKRIHRPASLIVLLVIANSTWALVCAALIIVFREAATVFGITHVAAEGLFVGGLAALEWRWRALLQG